MKPFLVAQLNDHKYLHQSRSFTWCKLISVNCMIRINLLDLTLNIISSIINQKISRYYLILFYTCFFSFHFDRPIHSNVHHQTPILEMIHQIAITVQWRLKPHQHVSRRHRKRRRKRIQMSHKSKFSFFSLLSSQIACYVDSWCLLSVLSLRVAQEKEKIFPP